MTSVIYETLRLFPPISQLINRRTTEPVLLGDEFLIPAGTYVGYNAYATGRDREAWGRDADEFRPERWGGTSEKIDAMYRRVNSRASFIAFHGGRRACLGQKFALIETRFTLLEIVRAVRWTLDPTWEKKMTPVSLNLPPRYEVKRLLARYTWLNYT
jgi:cytochrome P450